VTGGLSGQDGDRAIEDPRAAKVVTRRAPAAGELAALAFAWRVVKHVKSNAIAFTTADRTLALGGGQTSRVEPVRNARARAERLGISLRGSVLASHAFFPFAEDAECVPIAADDVKGLLRFAEERRIDLTVVGPELPLTLGLVDRLTAAGLRAFGPTAAAARLEGSKAFTKELLRHEHVPTAF